MKAFSKRVETLEADLTPKRLALKFLEAMTACSDLDHWIKDAYSDETLASLATIKENLYATVKRQVKDKDPQVLNKACRRAYQEFVYLYSLSLWPCQQIESERYRYLYHFSVLVYMHLKLLREEEKGSSGVMDESRKNEFWTMKRLGEKLLMEITADRLTEAKLSQHFFDGKSLWIREQKQFLDEMIGSVERLLGCFRDTLHYLQRNLKQHRRKKGVSEAMAFLDTLTIDLEQVLRSAERQAVLQFERAKQEAKISVYHSEDRQGDTLKMYQKLFKVSG